MSSKRIGPLGGYWRASPPTLHSRAGPSKAGHASVSATTRPTGSLRISTSPSSGTLLRRPNTSFRSSPRSRHGSQSTPALSSSSMSGPSSGGATAGETRRHSGDSPTEGRRTRRLCPRSRSTSRPMSSSLITPSVAGSSTPTPIRLRSHGRSPATRSWICWRRSSERWSSVAGPAISTT
jgi:hypothetical protein